MDIVKIDISYADGSYFSISNYDIEKLRQMAEVIQWLERAKSLYIELEPLFSKDKKGEK